MKEKGAEDRLAELIWRTLKIRIFLLVLAIGIQLVVWSALTSGDQKAQEVDIRFCQQLLDDQEKRFPTITQNPDVWCTPESARSYVEATRAASPIVLAAVQSAGQKETDEAKSLRKTYSDSVSEFAEYDRNRRQAFPLQLQFSSEYTGGNAILNGQQMAEFLPFGALILLSVIITLGCQQAFYKQELAILVNAPHSAESRALRVARSQFFADFGAAKNSRPPHLTLSPDRLVVGTLYAIFAVLFIALIFDYASSIIHLTDSLFFSYSFALYSTAFILVTLVVRTHVAYSRLRPKPLSSPWKKRTR
jgi:hypothetical protein